MKSSTVVKKNQKTLTGSTVEAEEQSIQSIADSFTGMVNVFTTPIIVWPGYEDQITDDQKGKVRTEKLVQVMEAKGKPITEATDYEAMLYKDLSSNGFSLGVIMTSTLANPPAREWYNIYAYLFRKFYPEQSKEIFDNWEGVKLEYQETDLLHNLKRWLLKSQMKDRKSKRSAKNDNIAPVMVWKLD